MFTTSCQHSAVAQPRLARQGARCLHLQPGHELGGLSSPTLLRPIPQAIVGKAAKVFRKARFVESPTSVAARAERSVLSVQCLLPAPAGAHPGPTRRRLLLLAPRLDRRRVRFVLGSRLGAQLPQVGAGLLHHRGGGHLGRCSCGGHVGSSVAAVLRSAALRAVFRRHHRRHCRCRRRVCLDLKL